MTCSTVAQQRMQREQSLVWSVVQLCSEASNVPAQTKAWFCGMILLYRLYNIHCARYHTPLLQYRSSKLVCYCYYILGALCCIIHTPPQQKRKSVGGAETGSVGCNHHHLFTHRPGAVIYGTLYWSSRQMAIRYRSSWMDSWSVVHYSSSSSALEPTDIDANLSANRARNRNAATQTMPTNTSHRTHRTLRRYRYIGAHAKSAA